MDKGKVTKRASVAVIGLGRVGLPLALVLAEKGYRVYGVGRNEAKITEINKGKMPFMEKGAGKILKKYAGNGFTATTDYAVIKACRYIILTLGTPIDENMNPVFDQIDASLSSAKNYLQKGQTLILRSTVTPGTTAYVASIVGKQRGISIGDNFFIAFCPERISEGRAVEEITTIPQIVGGINSESTRKAGEIFRNIGVPIIETDDVSAELAKLFTNMYRYINFAIANEFMMIAQRFGRDIHNIVSLVNEKYKRGGLAVPGLTAGPCLFKDGFFLIADSPYPDLIMTSWKINESVPLFLIQEVEKRISLKGKKAVILGVAFKGEIDDVRDSLSFKLRKTLLRHQAKVFLHDPYVKRYTNQLIIADINIALKNADVVIVATNHNVYKSITLEQIKKLVKKNCVICDIWNVFDTNKTVFTIKEITQ